MFTNHQILTSAALSSWLKDYLFSVLNVEVDISLGSESTELNFRQNALRKRFCFLHSERDLNSKISLIDLDSTSLLNPIGLTGSLTYISYQDRENRAHYEGNIDEGIDFDFVLMIAILLLRGEEYNSALTGSHERYALQDSLLYEGGHFKRPIVDEWVNLLSKYLVLAGFTVKSNEFEVHISHDVDEIFRYRAVPLRARLRRILGDIAKLRVPKAKGLTFDWLMDVSDRFGIKSNFYFIPSNTDRKYDFRYDINNADIKDIFRRIIGRGHNVGVHYSYSSSKMEKIANEYSIIQGFDVMQDRLCMGGRFHYLRIAIPESLDQIANQTNQSYENTLTFHETGGFRCATSRPFKYFNLESGQSYDLKILPLVVMDSTVFGYLNYDYDSALELFKHYIDQCKNIGGTFSLLWHNDALSTMEERKIYCDILEYAFK